MEVLSQLRFLLLRWPQLVPNWQKTSWHSLFEDLEGSKSGFACFFFFLNNKFSLLQRLKGVRSLESSKCWSDFCLADRLDIRAARILLDNDHYAMEKLKKRVLEYLAVRQLKNNLKGPILCFVGPPGVGKTSVGRSVAKTLGREFHRIALGGVCDQSDIRGHR